jgi:hypothetical protein
MAKGSRGEDGSRRGKLKRPDRNGSGLLYYPHKISRSGFLVMPLKVVVMVMMMPPVYTVQLDGPGLSGRAQQ